VPTGIDFERQKARFFDHFDCHKIDALEAVPEAKDDMMFFAASLSDQKMSSRYMHMWILRSVLFPVSGEAYLRGEDYWDVDPDGDGSA
jgi:hypothetical protein